jgi:ribosome maturation factor RimP
MAQARRTAAGARSGPATPASSATPPRSAARPGGGLAANRDRLRGIVEPIVSRAGYDLEELSVARAGRRSVVRVTIDGDAGVDHDGLAAVSREVSAALDASEESGGAFAPDAYELEISSPGVDRPLTLPRHWRRNIGRLVSVNANGRRLTGRIMAADAEVVILDVDGQRQEIPRSRLGPGRVQVEFGHLAEFDDAGLDETGLDDAGLDDVDLGEGGPDDDTEQDTNGDESVEFDGAPAESAQTGDHDEEGVDRA